MFITTISFNVLFYKQTRLAYYFRRFFPKSYGMGQNKLDKKQSGTTKESANNKNEKGSGDTSRSSNAGRKEASGGSKNTNNQGNPKGA